MISEIRPHKKLYVKWISDEMGFGVFTDEPILSGETVETNYCLIDNMHSAPHQDHIFSVRPDSTDVYHVLGYGAIYNHTYDPNIKWEPFDPERRIIRLYAIKDIEIDEELRWNYGKRYWEDRKKKKLL